jgi:hypothetical protein
MYNDEVGEFFIVENHDYLQLFLPLFSERRMMARKFHGIINDDVDRSSFYPTYIRMYILIQPLRIAFSILAHYHYY